MFEGGWNIRILNVLNILLNASCGLIIFTKVMKVYFEMDIDKFNMEGLVLLNGIQLRNDTYVTIYYNSAIQSNWLSA